MPEIVKRSRVAEELSAELFSAHSIIMAKINQAMPQAIVRPEAIARGAMTVINGSEALQRCTKFSIITAIVEAAQAGLSLDLNLGQAYMVPFGNQAKLIYGYRGMTELARRSGLVDNIIGELRYSKDKWKIRLGSNRSLEHEPADLPVSKRGEVLGVYATADFVSGYRDFEYMDIEQVDKIEASVRKRNGKGGVWETNQADMRRKSAVRKLCKRMPQSPAFMPLVRAAIQDEYREAGADKRTILDQPEFLEVKEAIDRCIEPEGIREPGEESESVIREKKPSGTVSYETACDMRSQCEEIGVKVEDVLRSMHHSGTLETLPVGRQVDFNKALSTHMGK